ncbi:MAG: AEC family transporter [Synergistaceae bacterium]|nr:AEC family transporter [Synergistaceae bacterium]
MNVFERMLNTQALMFVYVVTGIIMARSKILKHEGRSSFINLLLDITLPCMILHSFEVDVGINELIAAGEIIIISSGCFLIAWLTGKIFWIKSSHERKAVLEFATMFSNAGNAGLPIVASVFGTEGVFYASFYLLPARVLIWTVGLSMFVEGTNFRDKLKILLRTPSLDVVFIGLALMFLPVKLPSVLSTAIKNMGDMTGPLSMMIIGAALGESNLRDAFDLDAFKLTFVRLVVQPLIFLFLLRALGVQDILWQVTVTLTAMPAAANTEIIAEKYGKDYAFAARCVAVSTIISLVSVPVLTLLF